METIEALWAVHFGDVFALGQPNGGVAIFETSRIFGGDSQFYYVGEYMVSGETITAKVTITHFSGPGITAFGEQLTKPFQVQVEGRRDGEMINGQMWPIDKPDSLIPISLKRLENLP